MKEINYKDMTFNPFNLIGDECRQHRLFRGSQAGTGLLKLYQSELQGSGFLYQETIDENYPQRDFHTMYVGKIEKVLVRDDEYLKY